MYEEHFGLKTRPFQKTPDPNFLFPSRAHEEALARLRYAVEERDFALLIGEIGSGKTTLSRALIDALDEEMQICLIINSRLTPSQLLRVIAQRLGVESPARNKTDLVDQISGRLFALYEADRSALVIIDEAQLIPSKDTFDEIRLLTNFQMDDANLLSLILIGQPELERRLSHRSYDALRQRIGIRYRLGPLSREETEAYMTHRLKVAGCASPLFSDEAIELLFEFSGGIPRVINNIASNALVEGFAKEVEVVGPEIVKDVVEELGLAGNTKKFEVVGGS